MATRSSPTHVLARLSWPGSARQLAAIRIVLGLYLSTVFASGAIPMLRAIPAHVYPGTRSAFPLAFEAFAAQSLVEPMLIVGIVSTFAMTAGLLTRVSVWVTLVAYLVTQNFYYRMLTAHDDWLYFTFYLVVLGLAPCSDVWSIDSWWTKRSLRAAQSYRWPVELMGAWLAIVYAAAGIAKFFPLRKGVVWMNGLSMQGMVTNEIHESGWYWLLGHSLFDYRIRWPFVVLSLVGAVIELSAITVLLWRRAALPVAIAIVSLHVGVAMFGITGFLTMFLVAAIAWLEPQWFSDARAAATPNRSPHGDGVTIPG